MAGGGMGGGYSVKSNSAVKKETSSANNISVGGLNVPKRGINQEYLLIGVVVLVVLFLKK